MTEKKALQTDIVELRHRAEERLREQTDGIAAPPGTDKDPLRFHHELAVQQIELEMQNAELQQARSTLETALEQYTNLYDFAPVGYFNLDRNGTICRVNLTGAGLMGGERSKLLGKRFALFVNEGDRPAFATFLVKVFASPDKVACEVRLIGKGIAALYVQMEAVVDPSGQECRIAFVDITERKRAEDALKRLNKELENRVAERTSELAKNIEQLKIEARDGMLSAESLRKSEERFRALSTASSDVIYQMNPDWSEMRRLYGRNFISDMDNPSRTWLQEYIHPDDRSAVKTAINEAIRTKSVFELEHRVLRVDGTFGWTFSRAVPLLNGSGDIVEWFGAAGDISERKEAEEALRLAEAEARLRSSELETIMEVMPAVTFIAHDPLCLSMTSNRAAHELLHLPPASNTSLSAPVEQRPNTFRAIKDGRELSPEELPVQRAAATGQAISNCELTLAFDDGSLRIIYGNAVPLWDDSGKPRGAVGSFVDITERKQAEQKILESQQKLREMAFELQMAEDRERARIAGELHDRVGQRLLLGKMKLDMLSEAATDNLDEIAGLIEDSIQDIRSLTFQLRPPLLATAGLVEAVTWLCSELRDDYGLEAEVLDDQRPKPFKYEVLSVLYQAVRELLLNVVKHAGINQARLILKCLGDSLYITVADEGCGFNPTETRMRKTKTGGYGLFNLQQRIEYLSGRFEYETAPGKGTRATIIFPLGET